MTCGIVIAETVNALKQHRQQRNTVLASHHVNRASTLQCGIQGCTRERAKWQVSCAVHWTRLPDDLRHEAMAARKEQKGSVRHKVAVRAIFKHWGEPWPKEYD